MSPILDRIVRTGHGARRRTSQLAHSAGDSWGQLILAWRSVPVRTSVAGSERLPDHAGGSCGTMGLCAFRFGPGLGQRPRGWFSMEETAKGAVERL
ncbi:hypothetical protein F2Q68_00030687 [Brassica cretica]|uniref:Uncharacterized protein n=2 Tax=Brassica cretica TaxID=69181 RepID=A0ABQ7B6D6_BRACR|nr:hypothetical protein F2Q68_00030687 [Brassica cretica]KAF3527741.1 hypothetical protein DY000_02039244 [Brassica cretica]